MHPKVTKGTRLRTRNGWAKLTCLACKAPSASAHWQCKCQIAWHQCERHAKDVYDEPLQHFDKQAVKGQGQPTQRRKKRQWQVGNLPGDYDRPQPAKRTQPRSTQPATSDKREITPEEIAIFTQPNENKRKTKDRNARHDSIQEMDEQPNKAVRKALTITTQATLNGHLRINAVGEKENTIEELQANPEGDERSEKYFYEEAYIQQLWDEDEHNPPQIETRCATRVLAEMQLSRIATNPEEAMRKRKANFSATAIQADQGDQSPKKSAMHKEMPS